MLNALYIIVLKKVSSRVSCAYDTERNRVREMW